MTSSPVVRIVQLSDTHLSQNAPEARANWDAIVEHLAADPPDLVINTGDISLNGAHHLADLEYAFRAHQALPAPWRVIPGNHDVGDIGEITEPAGAGLRARFVALFGDAFWSVPCGEWDVIGIDIQALAAEDHAEELWDWLDGVLATKRPVMFCMHRPLMPYAAGETDEPRRYVTGELRARLRSLIAESSVRVVATGHVHQTRSVTIDERMHVWAPSTWALLPDSIQPVIGTKVVGFVEHRLGSDAHVTTVVPDNVRQHVIGISFPSPYSH